MSLYHVEIDCHNNIVKDMDTGEIIGGVDKWEMRDDNDRFYGRSIRVQYHVYIVSPPRKREAPERTTATVEQPRQIAANEIKALTHEK